ncbi:hypothetical protein ACMGD3_07440 [Lysinibacillus sphaericus]|uniref:hypothetical protein n=1 Tax=Lysinibacillus sphaericus TaxID=1421 RepID=UPI003F78F280
MAQYYYDKFATISTPIYTWQVSWGPEIENHVGTYAGYTTFNLDSNGDIILNGTYMDLNSVSGPTGTVQV